MDLQSLEQLESRISELTERFLNLQGENKKMRNELNDKNSEMKKLNEKLNASQRARQEIHSRVDNILKKLEHLRAQTDA